MIRRTYQLTKSVGLAVGVLRNNITFYKILVLSHIVLWCFLQENPLVLLVDREVGSEDTSMF